MSKDLFFYFKNLKISFKKTKRVLKFLSKKSLDEAIINLEENIKERNSISLYSFKSKSKVRIIFPIKIYLKILFLLKVVKKNLEFLKYSFPVFFKELSCNISKKIPRLVFRAFGRGNILKKKFLTLNVVFEKK